MMTGRELLLDFFEWLKAEHFDWQMSELVYLEEYVDQFLELVEKKWKGEQGIDL
jgi:hypothetical protein